MLFHSIVTGTNSARDLFFWSATRTQLIYWRKYRTNTEENTLLEV
jgi:hypothetical protein